MRLAGESIDGLVPLDWDCFDSTGCRRESAGFRRTLTANAASSGRSALRRRSWLMGVAVAIILAILGIAMAVYLVFVAR